jgi:exo-beta-1,3-glucanase (GH17 family)
MPRTNKVGRVAIWILAGVLPILTSLSNISFAAAQTPLRQTFGLDFSPYLSGQDPHSHSPISTRQIFDRLLIVSPYTHWVRTYGSTQGLENTPAIARQLGFKVAAGAWISGDMARNEREIANLISAANAGDVDVAIVGSEAILRGDVSTSQLIVYMDRVRQATHATVPVTTADEWGIFIAHPDLIEASDIVLAHFFPYWESMSIADATCSLAAAYRTLSVAAGPRSVWIGEAGWPTDGDARDWRSPRSRTPPSSRLSSLHGQTQQASRPFISRRSTRRGRPTTRVRKVLTGDCSTPMRP